VSVIHLTQQVQLIDTLNDFYYADMKLQMNISTILRLQGCLTFEAFCVC